eukprot:747044-Hanusia_phi.AAC.1
MSSAFSPLPYSLVVTSWAQEAAASLPLAGHCSPRSLARQAARRHVSGRILHPPQCRAAGDCSSEAVDSRAGGSDDEEAARKRVNKKGMGGAGGSEVYNAVADHGEDEDVQDVSRDEGGREVEEGPLGRRSVGEGEGERRTGRGAVAERKRRDGERMGRGGRWGEEERRCVCIGGG